MRNISIKIINCELKMSEDLIDDDTLLSDDDEEPITAQKVTTSRAKAVLYDIFSCVVVSLFSGARKPTKYVVEREIRTRTVTAPNRYA